MIVRVGDALLDDAARIHSESWCESHKSFCSAEFVSLHSVKHQKEYLQSEINCGKALYMLITDKPVGIVTVWGDLIENLYILPPEQRRGYGTELLRFAEGLCTGTPRLWILDNNRAAYSLYTKHGYRLTGKRQSITDTLSELEMAKQPADG